MFQEALTWGALILAGASLVAVIRFWIDIGRNQQRADDAAEAARLATAKNDLLSTALNEFKVEAARTYATVRALSETEASLARSFQDAVQGIYQRLDAMTQRLDSLITIAKQPH